MLLAVGAAVFAAAVAPWLPLVLVGGTYVIGHLLLPNGRERTVLGVGLAFVALLTVPFGLLTHGVLTGGAGPYAARPYTGTAEDLSTRMAIDSVDALGGTLVSYAASTDAPPVLAWQRPDGRLGWASELPRNSRISGLEQMRVSPLLWRIRLDAYAVGPDAPAWIYVWRWGGVQKAYVLRWGDSVNG